MEPQDKDKLKNGENDITTKASDDSGNKTVPQSANVDSQIDQSEKSMARSRSERSKAPSQEVIVNRFVAPEEESDVEEDSAIWKARMKIGHMVNDEKVQIFIILAIMINSLMMGIATADYVEDDPKVDQTFHDIDTAFLVIFTIEVAMQLFYLGLSLFSDGWLVFDLAIVILSWSFESLQIVRAFRIFRAFRLITRVKPLRDLVLAIGAVLPRMYAIAALLLLVFYIFSVLFTELYSDLELDHDYFGTLDKSLFTCMEMMTLEWGEICRQVMIHHDWAFAPFLTFIAITGFIVFNLIVAVVCDAVAVTEKNTRQMDGFEEDSTEVKIIEAQERIDLLQSHLHDMVKTGEQVQMMIESMAEELVLLQSERLNAEQKEAELRKVVEERQKFELQMEEKYFEGKKKRDEIRTSTIIGGPLFDAESIVSLKGDSISDLGSATVRERKRKLQRKIMERDSLHNSQAGGTTVVGHSTADSLGISNHNSTSGAGERESLWGSSNTGFDF